MNNKRVFNEGFPYFVVLLILTVVFYFISPILAIIPFILLAFVLFFFRNPRRKIVYDDRLVLSPADGTVMEIKEVYEEQYLKDKAIKVSIFLSLFDVHVNRSPIRGIVKYKNYREGKFLPAFKSHASEVNERNSVGIEGERAKVLVNQITGFIARRIRCWVNIGDRIEQGEIFGLIKFGSCTEVIVPLNVRVVIKVGQKVKAGITVIGVIGDDKEADS